jgi:hypothetical protein
MNVEAEKHFQELLCRTYSASTYVARNGDGQ